MSNHKEVEIYADGACKGNPGPGGWGAQAVELGLADGVAHLVPKLKALYGDKVKLIPHGRKRSLFQRLGLSLADETLGVLEDRALWARYGL